MLSLAGLRTGPLPHVMIADTIVRKRSCVVVWQAADP
jgi:hypothetical protein